MRLVCRWRESLGMEQSECVGGGSVMEASGKGSLLSCVLGYLEAREAVAKRESAEREAAYLLRTQRLLQFHERQRSELAELRRCLEYVNEHAHVIGAALRAAAGGGGGGGGGEGVPLAAALVRDVAAMRRHMEQSIGNAVRIRSVVGAHHQPFMDNLLRKMENELSNWTAFLNGASRALVNSGALMENIHNLIVAQQRMCAEVAASELFLSTKEDGSPLRELSAIAPAQLSSTPVD